MTPYYEQDGIVIYHGDCLEVLPTLGRFDLLLTDPPYGIGASAGVGKYGREKWAATDIGWDAQAVGVDLLSQCLSHVDHAVIFGGNYFVLPPSRAFLVWDKGAGFRGRDFAECEMAWCSWDGNAKLLTRDPLAAGDYRQKWHPTQKPEPVMVWALSQAPATVRTVLDPFMGSGTTLVATKRLGKVAVGIEREEKYCEIAARRLSQGALDLFGSGDAA